SVRVYAEHEFLRSNFVQRNEVKRWVVHFFDAPEGRPEVAIEDIQQNEAAVVRQHLNAGLFIINLAALGFGGLLSYWFAGRTLKPIEEAHEAQARFTADASHELKTPLANMKLENEVFLRQKHFTEDEARDQLRSNLEEVQRLERLSGNLLALHQYGQIALVRTPLVVKQVVEAAVVPLQASADAKKVQIEFNVAQGRILGHHDSLVQVVDILLDNALKYGARGGHITIEGHKKAGHYLLAVKDRGPGIASEDLPHIFDRLYRGDKARSTEVIGYGLGLSLAKEIADANGATISARNNPDGGACFEISLELAV
ncbi:MAG TPA: HAMP domain-containing sensor histidine kinase, partial [Candidatus Saccharimonadales bacterium]|nr:HAMP domain-containing sensor histidine kinase [Candidatus Saccharimonadales bacterium]